MFSPSKYTWRFFDSEKKMMLEQPLGWENQNSNHEGDALWRTGLSYIAYKEQVLKEGILGCYRKFTQINKEGKYWYQSMRCTGRYREDDVSRDQNIIALSSLYINGDMDEFNEIVNHLPYRLSRRFIMGPAMWLWLKVLTTGNKLYLVLYSLITMIELIISTLITKSVNVLLKTTKEYTEEELTHVNNSTGFWHKRDGKEWVWLVEDGVSDGKKMYGTYMKKLDDNKFLKLLDKMKHPAYALHLTGWIVYCLPNGFWKKSLNKLLWWASEKNNLLLKKLVGKDISQQEIDNYNPSYGFRWSIRFDGTEYIDLLQGEDAIYNVIDKDILMAL